MSADLAEHGYGEGLRRRLRRRLVLAAVAVGVAMASAGALWWAQKLMTADLPPGEAPLLRADGRPFKMRPQDRGGMAVPNVDRLIYEPGAAKNTVEHLLPPPEEPLPPSALPAARPSRRRLPRQHRLRPSRRPRRLRRRRSTPHRCPLPRRRKPPRRSRLPRRPRRSRRRAPRRSLPARSGSSSARSGPRAAPGRNGSACASAMPIFSDRSVLPFRASTTRPAARSSAFRRVPSTPPRPNASAAS